MYTQIRDLIDQYKTEARQLEQMARNAERQRMHGNAHTHRTKATTISRVVRELEAIVEVYCRANRL